MMLLTGANNAHYRHLMRHDSQYYGWLMQPRAYYRNKLAPDSRIRWAMDNDAYNSFDTERFIAALSFMAQYRDRCLFVVCPDVVGNHGETLELWHKWYTQIKAFNVPVAFVAQDGCVVDEVPWSDMDALFVGGMDRFKDKESLLVIRQAQHHGLWVHVGRVNDSPSRLRYCLELGVDSIDGTAFAYKPSKMLTWYQNQLQIYHRQRRLL